jgi:hypothetical protein
MPKNIDNCGPYKSEIWKLRSGGAVPIGGTNFLMQAFGADRNQVDTYVVAVTLPVTEDFTGASVKGKYVQSNFQRLPYVARGKEIFQGSVTHRAEFRNEREVPGESGWL